MLVLSRFTLKDFSAAFSVEEDVLRGQQGFFIFPCFWRKQAFSSVLLAC